MALRISEYRFWLLFAGLAIALLVACSSDSPAPGGSTPGTADAMTHA